MASHEVDIVARHVPAGEEVLLAFSAYTRMGLGRRVVGVTTRQLVVVKSGYMSLSDKGLLWAAPLTEIALNDTYTRWHTNGVYTGNAYVTIQRSDGSTTTLNPRSSFWGGRGSADDNIAALYSAIPSRY
ncbi:hypothetical protein RB614_09010 [Phytohabitans sp. ZYX-F-186]|uniref:YokE-like PH domain-containing protein n=1 Tax=Phytohabitans maris TaxID=3071409 RepID=A0ABU0ZE00_9ACTN|nr:hypothetical protein [Phytohabitans sp. ZYX-F-186]MDQ7904659.1 hypothetical protein [Phytohabitans sp. ZYX-F-186]